MPGVLAQFLLYGSTVMNFIGVVFFAFLETFPLTGHFISATVLIFAAMTGSVWAIICATVGGMLGDFAGIFLSRLIYDRYLKRRFEAKADKLERLMNRFPIVFLRVFGKFIPIVRSSYFLIAPKSLRGCLLMSFLSNFLLMTFLFLMRFFGTSAFEKLVEIARAVS